MQGWIKLHRMLQSWEWYNDSQTLHVFITVLLNANHEDGRWRGHVVKRGQWITGRKKLAEITGISEQSIRTILKRLHDSEELTIKSTSMFSIITVAKWDSYQIIETESTSGSTNNQPTINQRSTTNKNEENEKNEKKEDSLDVWIRKEVHKIIGRTMNSTEYGNLAVFKSYSRQQIEKAFEATRQGNGNSLNYILRVLQNDKPDKPEKGRLRK